MTEHRVAAKQAYDSAHIIAYVDGHETKIEVLSLFKPQEIVMKSEHSPELSMDYLKMLIEVKDKQHPVLRYFENKAMLYYKGTYYEHNVLPDIKPNSVATVVYNASEESSFSDYLEVKLYGEEYISNERITYRTADKPQRVEYYDVDGRILSTDEMRSLKLKAGEFTSYHMHGKEAAEKYGDPKFAKGIVVIKTHRK